MSRSTTAAPRTTSLRSPGAIPAALLRVTRACRALPEWYRAHAAAIARHSRPPCHLQPLRLADRLQERSEASRRLLPAEIGAELLYHDVQRLLTDLEGYLRSGLSPRPMAELLRLQRDFIPVHPDHVCTLSIAQRALTLACVGVELHREDLEHTMSTRALLGRLDALLERTGALREEPGARNWLRRDRDDTAEAAVALLSEAHRVAIRASAEDPGPLTHLRAMWRVHSERAPAVRPPRRRRALVITGLIAPGPATRCA